MKNTIEACFKDKEEKIENCKKTLDNNYNRLLKLEKDLNSTCSGDGGFQPKSVSKV